MSQAFAPTADQRPGNIALAALGPIAIGGIVAARTEAVTPLFSTPGILFGVVAATAPALYIALAATGHAPPIGKVVRAFGVAFAAFGVALAGLILPAAFLAFSSISTTTTFVVASVALAGAGILAILRLARELDEPEATFASSIVFFIWASSVAVIAGRLWFDLVQELAQ